MQKSIDDMLVILNKLVAIFTWSLGVFEQSSKLWAKLIEKLVLSLHVFSQSINKWAQLAKGVQGEQSGVNTKNVGRLRMWSNQKTKSVTFIHNDDVKCFHMVVQGTRKLVMMDHINIKDHALIERQ
jgi:hypothetical protein